MKSVYICNVKLKRIAALSLIFIVILSSMGFYSLESSRNQTTFKDYQTTTATQLIADGQDPSHEFRESFKTNHASQSNTFSYNFFYSTGKNSFEIICFAQYNTYLQKQLFQRPSSKLFLDFGSLII